MTTNQPPAPLRPSGGCSGEGCPSPDCWPLHHVRHRSLLCRLCTSCVLKYHPTSFCSSCFELLDASAPSSSSSPSIVHCSRCPSVSHTSCLPSPTSPYLCPPCASPHSTFSFFPIGSANRPSPDSVSLHHAKVLLAAAHISQHSMRKAAAALRAEADRKVRESVLARRRARDTLDRAVILARKDRESRMEGISSVTHPPPPDAKRKAVDAAGQRREKVLKVNAVGVKDESVSSVTRNNQDVPVQGNASMGILSGSPSTATLHS